MRDESNSGFFHLSRNTLPSTTTVNSKEIGINFENMASQLMLCTNTMNKTE